MRFAFGMFFSVTSILVLSFCAWSLTYDFSDPAQLSDWEVAFDAGGTWTVENGVLRYDTPSGRFDTLVLKNVIFTDGVVEVKMNWLEGTWCEGGVAYRIQEDGVASYNVHLSTSGDQLRWILWTAPDVLEKITRPTVEGWPAKEQWFTIRVEVQGANHKVYVDGNLIDDQDDDMFESGRAGLMGYAATAEVILFDDFTIEGPGIAAVQPQDKLAITWGHIKLQK